MPLVLNLLLYLTQPLSHQILKTFQLLNPINFQNKDPKNVLRPGPNLIQSVYFNMLMFACPVFRLPPLRLLSANQCEWRGPVKHKEVCTAGRRPALVRCGKRVASGLWPVVQSSLLK